jgi:hypothetical protein
MPRAGKYKKTKCGAQSEVGEGRMGGRSQQSGAMAQEEVRFEAKQNKNKQINFDTKHDEWPHC